MKTKMPSVTECDVKSCAFNNENKCHALAINVGGPDDMCACCDTFFKTKNKGGIDSAIAGVGACKVKDCAHNDMLECAAKGIHVVSHSGHADCATFTAR
jgi:hypothetical protein